MFRGCNETHGGGSDRSDRPGVAVRFFAGKGYGELKRAVAELVIMTLGPIQERYDALMHDRAALDALLQKGADTAQGRAAVTLRTARERVGLLTLS